MTVSFRKIDIPLASTAPSSPSSLSYSGLVTNTDEVVGELLDDVSGISGLVVGAVVADDDGLLSLDNDNSGPALKEARAYIRTG